MNILILVSGFPGVGKTTIAKKLAAKLGSRAKHFDIDDIKRNVVIDNAALENDIDPDEVRWVYYQEALSLALRTFDQGLHDYVIMDEVFHSKNLRTKIKAHCLENNLILKWLLVQCSYEIVEHRLNNKSREGHILTSEQCLDLNRKFAKIFDKFTIEESAITMNSDASKVFDFDISKIKNP